jgi:hypothetical protein
MTVLLPSGRHPTSNSKSFLRFSMEYGSSSTNSCARNRFTPANQFDCADYTELEICKSPVPDSLCGKRFLSTGLSDFDMPLPVPAEIH